MILAIVAPQNLESQAENTVVVLPRFPIKIWGKSVQGFKSYNQTFKQKNTSLYKYIDSYMWHPNVDKFLR